MDSQIDRAIGLIDAKLERDETIDILSLVNELENNGIETADAFEALLNDPTAFDWHYYALAGMRVLAEQGRLPRNKARTLLERTDRVAWQMGIDEFYKSIEAVVHSPVTVPALLDFVEERLLGQRDIREWRWLAFTAVASVLQSEEVEITSLLRDRFPLMVKLRKEIGEEKDENRNRQIHELLRLLP